MDISVNSQIAKLSVVFHKTVIAKLLIILAACFLSSGPLRLALVIGHCDVIHALYAKENASVNSGEYGESKTEHVFVMLGIVSHVDGNTVFILSSGQQRGLTWVEQFTDAQAFGVGGPGYVTIIGITPLHV